MVHPVFEKYPAPWTIGIALLAIIAIILLLSVTGILPPADGPAPACNTACPTSLQNIPVFTDPSEKIAVLKDPAFTGTLYYEALTLELQLATTGTRVHMGFWSGKGNHGSMLRVLDAINDGATAAAQPPNRAIWDEGTSAYYHYPSYTQLQDEHWYERASAQNGSALIFGRAYPDSRPVSFSQADEIWGEYSSRYTYMAEPVARATGSPVKVWCFIQGAKPNRIFFTYELPQLRLLEEKGYVQVYFAKSPDADWTQPGDWLTGTANASLTSQRGT